MCLYELELTTPDGEHIHMCIPVLSQTIGLPHNTTPFGVAFDDLRVLATIGELTALLNTQPGVADELRTAVESAVDEAARLLPAGVRLRRPKLPPPCQKISDEITHKKDILDENEGLSKKARADLEEEVKLLTRRLVHCVFQHSIAKAS
jgi:hypothetical protein